MYIDTSDETERSDWKWLYFDIEKTQKAETCMETYSGSVDSSLYKSVSPVVVWGLNGRCWFFTIKYIEKKFWNSIRKNILKKKLKKKLWKV